ncbi:MAG: hypothetical protein ACJ71K_12490 [Nitrososphaeraceae archaeon]
MHYLNKRDNPALKTATILSILALLAVASSTAMLSASPFWLSAEAATEKGKVNDESGSVGTEIPDATAFGNIPDIISNVTAFGNIPGITLNATDDISTSIPSVTEFGRGEQAGIENEQDDDEEEVLETDNLEDLAKYA